MKERRPAPVLGNRGEERQSGYNQLVTKEHKMETVKFHGKRIRLPWSSWEKAGVEISPEGLHCRGVTFSPANIDLMLWKASFYDRGMKQKFHGITNP